MRVKINESSDGGLTIERGPLLYAYPIPEHREEDTAIYENLAGKLSGNPAFKSWSMTPAGKWNYAIDAGKLNQINVKETQFSGVPCDLDNSPVTVEVPVGGVKGWRFVII